MADAGHPHWGSAPTHTPVGPQVSVVACPTRPGAQATVQEPATLAAAHPAATTCAGVAPSAATGQVHDGSAPLTTPSGPHV